MAPFSSTLTPNLSFLWQTVASRNVVAITASSSPSQTDCLCFQDNENNSVGSPPHHAPRYQLSRLVHIASLSTTWLLSSLAKGSGTRCAGVGRLTVVCC